MHCAALRCTALRCTALHARCAFNSWVQVTSAICHRMSKCVTLFTEAQLSKLRQVGRGRLGGPCCALGMLAFELLWYCEVLGALVA